MACGKPPPSCKQMQLNICQICGNDMKSCNAQQETTNYQKQVDPPATPYSQIIPDYRYDEDLRDERRRKGKPEVPKKATPYQVCVPIPVVTGKSTTNTAKDSGKNDTNQQNSGKNEKEKQKEKEKEEEKEKENQGSGNSPAMKASCFPDAGGSDCGKPVKMMLCLPCPPPPSVANASGGSGGQCANANKPKDYSYRCESRELRGGNLYSCCQCIKRNGLQHDCPRTPCQGRPACLTKPWPDCWPSGGCHGIDFSREKGVKRYDPCREQRFDKKECGGPGGGGSGKADCGGNMMVVVCPPPGNEC